MDRIEISNTIRKLRFEHGEMTQLDLARRTGVTRQTILAIESGKYSPSLELAFRIARVFELSLEEVFSCRFHEKPVDNPGKAGGT
ncbi:MAG: helix-turn-helix transcriptional regulator [Clostridia bacterium]|nr:helix-turn-helix transcriptional regulator [Clostridia bacterium]